MKSGLQPKTENQFRVEESPGEEVGSGNVFAEAGKGTLSMGVCGPIKTGSAVETEDQRTRQGWREGEEDDKPVQEGGRSS